MSNFFFSQAMVLFAQGELDWRAIDARAVLVNENTGHYDPSVDHLYLNDIAIEDRLATTASLTGKVVLADGVLDADDSQFPAVPGGADELGMTIIGSAVVLYSVIGDASTSPLICHIDQMQGLPITPNGTTVDIIWNNGDDRIGRI